MLATAPSENAIWLKPRFRMEGASEGPLKGLTFAAKDLFDVSFNWDTVPPLLLARVAIHSAGQGLRDRPWQSHLARDTSACLCDSTSSAGRPPHVPLGAKL